MFGLHMVGWRRIQYWTNPNMIELHGNRKRNLYMPCDQTRQIAQSFVMRSKHGRVLLQLGCLIWHGFIRPARSNVA